ncbi:helix-turn-helix domain-containing protein [Lentzea flaviverrucosa]|uniref:Helix-turn-helix domain-containing protein n=1 Tax=Lentzea flaviverrucosa TaxID=200379 RepID=A0A1H9XYN0_9PSEU|nr:helix-turn-helix protein [Lentzea flaviverrucosa]SES51209.1 Helix-turn-helix domain-containing protein [Lentzea flaviverrucosa]
MSIKVVTLVWEHAPAAGNELLLLLAIADQANDLGTDAWPSVDTLARKTRLNKRTVQRLLQRLSSAGLVAIEPGGGRRSNRYTIDLNLLADPSSRTTDDEGTPPALRHPRQSVTCGTHAAPAATALDHRSHDTAVSPDPSCTALSPSPPSRTHSADADEAATTETARAAMEITAKIHTVAPMSHPNQRAMELKVLESLAAGHDPDQILRILTENLHSARSPIAVIHSRLRSLPLSPIHGRTSIARPEWCGTCDGPEPHRRWIQLDDGRVQACPHCHPKHNTNPAATSR